MNASVKAVGMAVGMWAGVALADAPGTGGSGDLSADPSSQVAPESTTSSAAAQDLNTAVDPLEEPATGGSAAAGTTATDTAADPSTSTTGTTSPGATTTSPDSSALQASPDSSAAQPTQTQTTSTTRSTTSEYAEAPAATLEESKDKKKGPNLRGLQVMLGGGVEGYTGDFASRINAGPAWGLTVAVKPTSVLGLELGYSGAVNEISSGPVGAVDVEGSDIVRNGLQAVATFGLAAVAVQPYILGGVGVNRYDVRASPASGFRDDTSGNIPLGAGLRTHIGPVAADLRVAYNVLFSNDFAAFAEGNEVAGVDTTSNGGRYTGMLQVGSNF